MSRASIIAMLVAAEIVIVGVALYTLGHGRPIYAANMHHVDFSAKTFAPVAVGRAPHVVVDDAESRVTVGVSTDGLVHVRDLTQIRGAVFSSGAYSQLHVERTADGVRIERPRAEHFSVAIFGFSTQAISVDVPTDSRLEIVRCAGARISGMNGAVAVHSVDGRITMNDLQGTVEARSDDGSIILTNAALSSLFADTHDGRIEADRLSVAGEATMQTNDGSVRVRLAPNADLTIDASTRDGSISVNGDTTHGDDSAQRTIRLGAGTGRMKLATDDGSIHIFTNGAFQ